jgi:hypothetical protein
MLEKLFERNTGRLPCASHQALAIPAVAIAGIRPVDAPGFIVAELLGPFAATTLCRYAFTWGLKTRQRFKARNKSV